MAVTEDGQVFVWGSLPSDAWGQYMTAGQAEKARYLLPIGLPQTPGSDSEEENGPEDDGETKGFVLLRPLLLPGVHVCRS